MLFFSLRSRSRYQLRRFEQVIPPVLRICAAALAVVMLAGMTIVMNKSGVSMIVLADRSDSMHTAQADVDACMQSLSDGLSPDTRMSVVAFGGNTVQEQPFLNRYKKNISEKSLFGAATDISAALYEAVATIPRNTRGRIVLLTDGLETDGSVLNAMSALANRGIRLDAMLYDTRILSSEVQVKAISLPADTALGQPFQLSVSVTSNTASSGTLALYEEDALIKEVSVRIQPGMNTYSYSVTPTGVGERAYHAELVCEADTMKENNIAFGCVNALASDCILIVEGGEGRGQSLQEYLNDRRYETKVVSCAEMPSTISELCEYGLIILMNADAQVIGDKRSELLDEYVSVYGRSVLTAGGENTYIYGNMTQSAFEQFLPVDMEVEERESAEPVALMLIIDNSASMSGTAIVMAKRGAIKSIEALNKNDYIGVITFSTGYEALQPLTGMYNKNDVITKVSGIGTMMGTMYNPALDEALRQMESFDKTPLKHIILMSDGNPSDEGYDAIVRRMALAGITVSTIAVGLDISAENMIRLANIGGGRCYIVTDSYDLPSIMATDTIIQQVDYLCEGNYLPTIGKRVFSVDQRALPITTGYVRVTPKSTADVVLYAENDCPLYVRWDYGAGMAGSFMSDLSDKWCAGWFAPKSAGNIIKAMVDDLLPDEHIKAATVTSLSDGGVRTTLHVEAADALENQTYSATVTSPSGEVSSYYMSRTEDGAYECEMPIQGFGKYEITLEQYDSVGKQLSAFQTAAALSWSAEYEAFNAVDPLSAITELCAATGGEVLKSAEALNSVELEELYVEYDPTPILALLAFLCIILQILYQKTKLRAFFQAFNRLLKK